MVFQQVKITKKETKTWTESSVKHLMLEMDVGCHQFRLPQKTINTTSQTEKGETFEIKLRRKKPSLGSFACSVSMNH